MPLAANSAVVGLRQTRRPPEPTTCPLWGFVGLLFVIQRREQLALRALVVGFCLIISFLKIKCFFFQVIDSIFPMQLLRRWVGKRSPCAVSAWGCFSGLKHHGLIKCVTNKNQHFILAS